MTGSHKYSGKFSAIVLAAGKSKRMGMPKLWIKHKNGLTFWEHLIKKFEAFGCREIITVINSDAQELMNNVNVENYRNHKFAINEYPDWERFYSLKVGIKKLKEVIPVFIHNIDNPFVEIGVLESLANQIYEADYISPSYRGKGGHPNLISTKIVKEILNEPEDQIHLKEFLSKFQRKKIEIRDKRILLNINTEEKYEEWKA